MADGGADWREKEKLVAWSLQINPSGDADFAPHLNQGCSCSDISLTTFYFCSICSWKFISNKSRTEKNHNMRTLVAWSPRPLCLDSTKKRSKEFLISFQKSLGRLKRLSEIKL